jgi:hypothetical protein
MKYRELDSAGDMQLGRFLENTPEAVAQAVLTRLRLWREEWFLDVTDGTPWAQLVLGHGTQGTAMQAIRQRILDTEGVTEITSLSFEQDAERRSVVFQVQLKTAYGDADVYGVL